MKNLKIKSYCKINLCLQIIKKLNNGYHKISSLITFCDLHDVISISKIKNSKDKHLARVREYMAQPSVSREDEAGVKACAELLKGYFLEIGCRDGKYAKFISKYVHKYCGLDIDENSLVKAGKKVRDENVQFFLGLMQLSGNSEV